MTASAAVSPVPTRPRGNTVDLVVRHLRDGILNNRYAPGQRLIEADLTEQLAVSRGPVREGLRRLSAEGLIEMVPNRGALVRRLTYREAVELFQIRTALEALAVTLTAQRVRKGELRARFERAIAPIWSEAPRLNAAAYLEENKLFHQALVEFSGNEQLAQVSRQMQFPLILFQTSGALDTGSLANSVKDHRQIATAILDGKPEAADARIRTHLERASHLLDDMPKSIFRSDAIATARAG